MQLQDFVNWTACKHSHPGTSTCTHMPSISFQAAGSADPACKQAPTEGMHVLLCMQVSALPPPLCFVCLPGLFCQNHCQPCSLPPTCCSGNCYQCILIHHACLHSSALTTIPVLTKTSVLTRRSGRDVPTSLPLRHAVRRPECVRKPVGGSSRVSRACVTMLVSQCRRDVAWMEGMQSGRACTPVV